jgi:hypothetical protein
MIDLLSQVVANHRKTVLFRIDLAQTGTRTAPRLRHQDHLPWLLGLAVEFWPKAR